MSNKEVKITIEAIDKFSSVFEKLDKNLEDVQDLADKMSGSFDDFANGFGGNKLGKIAAEVARIGAAMQTTAGRAGLAASAVVKLAQGYMKLYDASKKNFVGNLETLGTVFETILKGLGGLTSGITNFLSGITGMDLTLSGIGQSSVKFGEELTRAFMIAGGGSDSLKGKMKGAAQEVSMQFGRSMNEVAQGMQEIASAGMDAEQVVELLGATTAVSMAGNLDMARSAEVLTNTMRAFKEESFDSETAWKYANTLAKVSDKSATDINQIGEALKNSANMAGQMGYSVEDVGTVIGLMGNQFVKSGRAGTALNNIMTRVASGNSNCMKTIQDYNLEGYKQKMLNGDLVGAMIELQSATEGLTNDQKAQIATGLAGTYGMQGLLAVMGQTTEETQKFRNELKGSQQAQIMQQAIAETTSGKMAQLSSTIGVVGEAIYSKFEPHLRTALDSAINFAKGLVEVGDEGYYVIKSLDKLEQASKGWGKGLEQGIQSAINGIKKFVTGGSLDSILNIGTNIIQGICRGISNNKGTLQETFSAIIQKACNFIKTNSAAIGQAGKDILTALSNAIRENEGLIKEALDSLLGIVTDWAKGGAELQSAMGLFADSMINALVDQAIVKATGKGGEIWNALWSGATVEGGAEQKSGLGKMEGGLGSVFSEDSPNGFLKMLGSADTALNDWLVGGIKKVGQGVKNWFTGSADAAEVSAAEGGKHIGNVTGENVKIGFDEQGQPIVQSATQTGTDAAAGIEAALRGMDLQYLQSLGQEMTNVGTLTSEMATSMSTSFTNIANSARTSFTNMSTIARAQLISMSNATRTQMLSVSNIIRNQMLNSTNIVKNQATNMTNAVRTGFVNMANIARNQFVNVANIVRNQMLNCTNIVKNQSTNMNDTFRTAFVNMANIANNQMPKIADTVRTEMLNCTNIIKNQAGNMSTALAQGMSAMASSATAAMAKVVAAVRNGMAQARAVASQPISINITSNISRKVTTTHVAGGIKQTMANISAAGINVQRPNTATATSGGVMTSRVGDGGNLVLSVPLVLDGKEIARATAKYNQAELQKMEKRTNRKRGE